MNQFSARRVFNVLLLEDNRVVRKLLETIIEKSEHFRLVAQLDNAESLLSLLREKQPDLVIADIGLPGITGIEATRMIKKEFPETFVLILTARTADALFFDSFLAGADGYMLKDKFSEEKLMLALETVSSGKVWLDPLIARQVLDYNTDAESLRQAAKAKPVAVQTLSEQERKVLNKVIAEDSTKITDEIDRRFLENLSRLAPEKDELS